MNDEEQRLAWIKQWETAKLMLAAQSESELQEMTTAERQRQIENLLDLACKFHRPRLDDGLIKLKKAFREMFAT